MSHRVEIWGPRRFSPDSGIDVVLKSMNGLLGDLLVERTTEAFGQFIQCVGARASYSRPSYQSLLVFLFMLFISGPTEVDMRVRKYLLVFARAQDFQGAHPCPPESTVSTIQYTTKQKYYYLCRRKI